MRSWILWVGLMATGLLVAALAYGCGETSFGTCADNGTCIRDGGLLDGTSAGDTSTDVVVPPPDGGAGDDGSVPPHRDAATGEAGPGACNTTLEPKDEACLVDATYGVFVSPKGTASGAGTQESPLNSIDAGISLAVMQGGATPKSVYVCAGTYDETIAIAAARDKVKVYGGFACSDWSYTGVMPVLAPSTQGPALTLTGLTSALFVDLGDRRPERSVDSPRRRIGGRRIEHRRPRKRRDGRRVSANQARSEQRTARSRRGTRGVCVPRNSGAQRKPS